MMNPGLTREYAERTSESKISLIRRIKIKLKGRKDSGAYQSFFSEVFYSGYRFWTKFLAVLRSLAIFSVVFRFLIGPYAPLIKQRDRMSRIDSRYA